MKTKSNRAVCVLGMHRSGTSALAHALEILGVYLGPPEELMRPSFDNRRGFFELNPIVGMHEQLLHALGRSWDSSLPMPANWWELPEVKPFCESAGKIIDDRFARRWLWGWKDPRTCLALPLWQRVLARRNCQLCYIIVTRNPLDIAASLAKRNSFPQAKSLAMNILHMLYALRDTRGAPRALVSYERLIADTRSEIMRVARQLDLPTPSAEMLEEIGQWIDPVMAHNRSAGAEANGQLNGPARRLHELMLDLEAVTTGAVDDELESLLAEYEGYANLVATQVHQNPTSIGQIFDYSSGVASESESVSLHLASDGQTHEYEFVIPWAEATALRFDPGDGPSMLDIESVAVWDRGEADDEPATLLHQYHQNQMLPIQQLIASNELPWTFLASGADPQLLLPLDPTWRGPRQRVLRIAMSLRYDLQHSSLLQVGTLTEGLRKELLGTKHTLKDKVRDLAGHESMLKQVGAYLADKSSPPHSPKAAEDLEKLLESMAKNLNDYRQALEQLELPAAPEAAKLLDSQLWSALTGFLRALKNDTYVVAISHADYLTGLGGTEKMMREEQQRLAEQNISYMQLSVRWPTSLLVSDDSCDLLITLNVDSQRVGHYSLSFLSALFDVLGQFEVARPAAVHLHHLMHWPLVSIESLLSHIRPPITRVWLHDYYTICPQFNLLRNDTDYCGGSPEAEARLCGACRHFGQRREHFAATRAMFARQNLEFVTPSEVAAKVWAESFPQFKSNLRVVAHQRVEEIPTDHSQRLARLDRGGYRPRIAYIGYQSINKGWHVYDRVMREGKLRRCYDFYALGACSTPPSYMKHVPVSFVDEGLDAMMQALRNNGIDIAFLWSIWPETYSYTAFEAMAENCFIITNADSGNIAVQAAQDARGRVFDSEQQMLAFLRDPRQVKQAIRDNLTRNTSRWSLHPSAAVAEETAASLDAEPQPCRAEAKDLLTRLKNDGPMALLARLRVGLRQSLNIAPQAEAVRQLEDYVDYLNEEHRTKDSVINYYRSQPLHRGIELARKAIRAITPGASSRPS